MKANVKTSWVEVVNGEAHRTLNFMNPTGYLIAKRAK